MLFGVPPVALSPPGSDARYNKAIEELLHARGPGLSEFKYGLGNPEELASIPPPVLVLWRGGFDAVPILIRHLGDRRITKIGRKVSFTVGDVATDLLDAILLDGPDFYARMGKGSGSRSAARKQAQIKAIWKGARSEGERKYLFRKLQRFDEDQKGALWTVSGNGLRAFPLEIVAYKYPDDLARYFMTVRYYVEADQIANALIRSPLPSSRKDSILRAATRGAAGASKVAHERLGDRS